MSELTTIGLPVALGIIMFGLGLSLTLGDFARVAKHPKAVIVALACQLLVLPALCFGIVLIPVALGMLVRRARPAFADRMDKPVRIASIIILVVVIAGAVASNLT